MFQMENMLPCHQAIRQIEPLIQWLFLVPLKGGRWHIIPELAVYTTYIPLIVLAFWGVICYRSHLLGEPETTLDSSVSRCSKKIAPFNHQLVLTIKERERVQPSYPRVVRFQLACLKPKDLQITSIAFYCTVHKCRVDASNTIYIYINKISVSLLHTF